MTSAVFRPHPVLIEIGVSSLHALRGDDGLEVPLARQHNGRLTGPCKEQVATALREFLARKTWPFRLRAYCAIAANGVSIRRIGVPAAAADQFDGVLRLQIESRFPLAPDELAWGSRRLNENGEHSATAQQQVLVIAVKKDVIDEYAKLLGDCGLEPVFTVAALARGLLCSEQAGSCAILNVGRTQSEWASFEKDVPTGVRVFPWGTEALSASDGAWDAVSSALRGNWSGKVVYLTGDGDAKNNVALQVPRHLGAGTQCRPIQVAAGPGRTAAVLGLKKCIEENGVQLPPVLKARTHHEQAKLDWSAPTLRKWAATAALLLVVVLMLPYVEALAVKPFLVRRMAVLKAGAGRLATIDQELGFLQFMKQNQPPYLDALYLMAQSAPPGARLESLTMNRRGEVSLRGSMRNSQEVGEFRAKLIHSGFFSEVSVDEQVPTQDRQKVNVRMTAQWKPAEARELLSIGPTAEELAKAKKEPKK
jgi:hypothetical protein